MFKSTISILLGFTIFSAHADYQVMQYVFPSEIDDLATNLNDSMEIEPLDDGPTVFIEVEWVPPTNRGEIDKVEVVSSDSEIAEQLVLKWGAEIHCLHRIKKLEVDHPSANVGVDNNTPVFETLVQQLPSQSPFKQGLRGTFDAVSYQIGALKQACIDKVESGEIDLEPYNEIPDSFIVDPDDYGNGDHRLFLRGQCSSVSGNTITESFDAPGSPNGIPFSPPPVEVYCQVPQFKLQPKPAIIKTNFKLKTSVLN